MIDNNHRLIIICGMAHTGTTIIADILRQHPGNVLVKNGAMYWILENDYLLHANTEGICELLSEHKKRIILKRPWVEHLHTQWLTSQMPDAYYLYCKKDKEKTIKSWSRENSYVESELRNDSYEDKSAHYDACYKSAMELRNKVQKFLVVENEDVIQNPEKAFSDINKFLELPEFDYDLSEVSQSRSIKKKFVHKVKEKKSLKHYFNLFLMKSKAFVYSFLNK